MSSRFRASLLVVLVWATPLWAAPPERSDGPGTFNVQPLSAALSIYDQLFPPRLVMRHQQEIGLKPGQVDAIKREVAATQQQIVELQWKLDAASEDLRGLLTTDHVDEQAVVAKLEEITSIEQRAKTMNFTLLVRIKNHLDPDQQTKLRALRPSRPSGPPRRLPPAGAPFLDS